MIRRLAACAAAVALLSSCSFVSAVDSAGDPTDLYTISPKSTFDSDLPAVYWQLAVEAPVAAANLNTGRIAIAMTPTSTDYYAKVAWTEGYFAGCKFERPLHPAEAVWRRRPQGGRAPG